MAESEYPHADGDVTVLGPEVFASADGSVISWRGENYYRDAVPSLLVAAGRLLDEADDDLLDDTAIEAFLDRDDHLARHGMRTLFSPEGKGALRTMIARRRDGR